MTDDKTPFLARWSRRKAEAQEVSTSEPALAKAGVPQPPDVEPVVPPMAEPEPTPPTLEDVAQLTREADFSRFVGASVDSNVRNAALKKLFTDPHFNVMDGLDTYIDDYGKPDPLPRSMLRLMAQSGALGLLDDDAPQPPAGTTPPSQDEDPDLQLQPNDAIGRPGPEPGAGEDPAGQR